MKYIKRLFFILFLVIGACGVGNWIYKSANLYYSVQFQKVDQMFNKKINAEILLLGSSRVYNTINPKVLEDSLGMKTYNAGMAGANFREQILLLKVYLENNKQPKIVLCGLDLFSMDIRKPFGFYGSYLYNLDNEYVEKEMNRAGVKTNLYRLVPFFVVTEFDDYYRGNVLKAVSKQSEVPEGDFVYNGYFSNTLDTISQEMKFKASSIIINRHAIDTLQRIIDICKERDIKLILTYSPEYKQGNIQKTSNSERIFKLYDSVALKNGIPFWRNDKLIMCSNPKYFANVGHVNRIGADVYSKVLATQIKTRLND